MKNITLADVAKEAHVSIATVSRALNQKGHVSEEKTRRIEAAIKKLDYRYPGGKIGSKASEKNVLLMVIPSLSNPFYNEIINGFQYTAMNRNYETLLCQSISNKMRMDLYLDSLRKKTISGAAVLDASVKYKEYLPIVGSFPLIQCCEYHDDLHSPYVAINNSAAAKIAVIHLYSVGYRKIAMLNARLSFRYARERLKGYQEALKEINLSYEQKWVVSVQDISYSLALSVAENLLSQPDRPDAVFAVSDVLAAAVIKAAKRLKIKVPDELGVIGFDNTEISLMCDPSISTMNQPRFEIGSYACNMLIDQINQLKGTNQNLILDTELIVRESTLR